MKKLLLLILLLPGLSVAQSACDLSALVQLPDLQIAELEHQDRPVAHCKVSGTIGTEIRFELLLPDTFKPYRRNRFAIISNFLRLIRVMPGICSSFASRKKEKETWPTNFSRKRRF